MSAMGRHLHIAWDNSLAGRNRAGTGVYASELLRQLATAPDLKVKVFDYPSRPGEHGGSLARGIQNIKGLLWAHYYLPRLLGRGNFDLLHSPAFIVPIGCPCPSVVTVHDLTFVMFPQHFERRWRLYLKWMMPSVLRSASAVICVSQQTKTDLLRYYSVSPDKIHVVYNGIDHTRFHPGANLDVNWARGVGIRGGYLLHLGTLSYRKNIKTLLLAIAKLRSNGKWTNRQLVLAGAEIPALPGAAEIHETVQALDLAPHVILAGHVPDEHLPGLYADASVLVMPSLYEGFGLPVLESMAVGTPVVTSDASSLAEIAGDAAILVPAQDEAALAAAIDKVLQNGSIAEELRRKGLAWARHFSWRRAALETIRIYRSVASA
jgi:glycosyltransferase involved in cell wall biosynthesis